MMRVVEVISTSLEIRGTVGSLPQVKNHSGEPPKLLLIVTSPPSSARIVFLTDTERGNW